MYMYIVRDRVDMMELGGKVPLHSSHIGMERSLQPTMQSTGFLQVPSPATKDMEIALHPVHIMETSQQVPTAHLMHGNLCYEDVEGEGGDHRRPRMGSICDGDNRPQRSPSGNHCTTSAAKWQPLPRTLFIDCLCVCVVCSRRISAANYTGTVPLRLWAYLRCILCACLYAF